jgi:hypothetical protein
MDETLNGKQFFEKYQDRILFCKDLINLMNIRPISRWTEDKYFLITNVITPLAHVWSRFSDEVLKKVYYKNAFM